MKGFKAGAVLFLAAMCVFGCRKVEPVKIEAPQVIPVKVSTVELKDIDELLEYAGEVKAQNGALIYPKVSGKIIEKTKIDADPIAKGEALAYIDRDQTGLDFQRAPVESTIGGIIGRVYVDIGENVTADTPVALVVDISRVKISFQAPEKYLPKIFPGQQAFITVDAYPDIEFEGAVTEVSPVLDSMTRSAPVEIAVDNPEDRLKPGMFAKINLVISRNRGVPVILKEALMGKDSDTCVYVVENKKAVLRKVKAGIRQGPYLHIREGLKEGEMAVIMGQQRLKDGALVEPEE